MTPEEIAEALGTDVVVPIDPDTTLRELRDWFAHRQRRLQMGTLSSPNQECNEDGCTWDYEHNVIEHCMQDKHCIAMDATCAAEVGVDDHPRHCCICGELVTQ